MRTKRIKKTRENFNISLKNNPGRGVVFKDFQVSFLIFFLTSAFILSILNNRVNSFKKVIFIAIFFLIISGIGFVYLLMQQDNDNKESLLPKPETAKDEIIDLQIQKQIAFEPKIETSSVNSPDGKYRIIMDKTSLDNLLEEYSFSVEDLSTKNTIPIFKKNLSSDWIFELPLNSWSPDNKYVFIKEKTSVAAFFVFKASGEPFFDDKQYIDVLQSFEEKNKNYKLADVTGWDSPTLLHLLTKGEDGRAGPSFWFEVPSKAVIQLSSH